MTQASQLPQAIEGESVQITGRKITAQGAPRSLSLLNSEIRKFFPVRVSYGEGEIVKSSKPPVPIVLVYSKVNVGARAVGAKLRGGTEDVINIGDIKVGTPKSRTSAHKNQEYTTQEFTWLVVVATQAGEVLLVDPWKRIENRADEDQA